jgi:hypothetical protein
MSVIVKTWRGVAARSERGVGVSGVSDKPEGGVSNYISEKRIEENVAR